MDSVTNAPLLTCLNCRKKSADCKTCQSCKVAYYCGKECQKASYKQHKETCYLLKLTGAMIGSMAYSSDRNREGKVFSWDFLAKNKTDWSQSQGPLNIFEDRYASLLFKVGCMERNKIAFSKFLDFFWDRLAEGVYTVDYYSLRAVLMLLALGRVQEADDFVYLMHLDPEGAEMKKPSRDALREKINEVAFNYRQETSDFIGTVAIVQNWFLVACVLVSRLVPVRKEAEEAIKGSTLLGMEHGEDSHITKIDSEEMEQLEADLKEILLLIHEFNEFLLPGIVNPMTLGVTPEMPNQYWRLKFMVVDEPDLVGPNTPRLRKEFTKNYLEYILVLLQMADGLNENLKKFVVEFGVLNSTNSA